MSKVCVFNQVYLHITVPCICSFNYAHFLKKYIFASTTYDYFSCK
jgi:hypothetical protein